MLFGMPLLTLYFLHMLFTKWSAMHCVFYRYNAQKGLLTLVSEKYDMREENRRHIMRMLTQLVEEGHKAYPSESAAQTAT